MPGIAPKWFTGGKSRLRCTLSIFVSDLFSFRWLYRNLTAY